MQFIAIFLISFAAAQAQAEYYCNNAGTDMSGAEIAQANVKTETTLGLYQQKFGPVSVTKVDYGFYCESLISRIAFEWNGQRCSVSGSDVMCNGQFVMGPLMRFNGELRRLFPRRRG